ncbi:hypothetical protein GCK32_001447 [Trichostrongylus colubriformis]|uniref:G-protein coupled receptors family 1 profile domain-containing protein n=1 Tax=Trichostrongylus colubriformis TaxID=6319 RepID=A0AAN8EPJ6_TRICO
MTSKFWLGGLLGIFTFVGFLLTAIVLVAVMKLVFKGRNSIYVIAAGNLFCDLIQLLLALFYLTPTIMLDDWLLEGGRFNPVMHFLSATFLFCWHYGSSAQILMAINRLVVLCFTNTNIFSLRNVSIITITLFPLSILLALVSQYVLPCCKYIFDHEYLSYSYISIGDIPNYTKYIHIFMNSFTSAICLICYSYIIFYVWRMNNLFRKGTAGSGNRRKEYIYALQFCAISVFYLSAWVTFQMFSLLIKDVDNQYFIVIPICVTINSAANAVVYITSNKEVKAELILIMQRVVHPVSMHPVSMHPVSNLLF